MDVKIHVDFHTQPNITDLGRNFDAEKFARRVAMTGAKTVNVFIRCNQGYCYFPTSTGKQHPSLSGDLLGDMVRECRLRGIGVIGYVNVAVDHLSAAEHPEYRRTLKSGATQTTSEPDAFCRTMCVNTPYGEKLLAIVAEALEKYDLDGIFADNLLPLECYCSECLERMNALGVDTRDDAAVSRYALDKSLAYAARLRELTGDKTLEIKGLPLAAAKGLSDCAYLAVMPQSDGYDAYPAQAAYARGLYKNVYFLTGRFLRGWGDFGGYRGMEAFENDVCDALIGGTGICLGDHMSPSGNLNEQIYKEASEALKPSRGLDAHTRDEHRVSDAAVLINTDAPIGADICGAARLLSELKLGFDIIDGSGELERYDLLILPESFIPDDDIAQRLRQYDKAIVCAGASGVHNGEFLDESFGAEYEGEHKGESGYYDAPGMPVACYSKAIRFRSQYSLYRYIPPCNEPQWRNDRPFAYTPPSLTTGFAAVSLHGNRAVIGFGIFGAYEKFASPAHRDCVKLILDRLLPERTLVTTLPLTARVAYYRGDSHATLLVKTTFPEGRTGFSTVNTRIYEPAGHTVTLSGEYTKAYALPSREALEIKTRSGKTSLTLPCINGFLAIALE